MTQHTLTPAEAHQHLRDFAEREPAEDYIDHSSWNTCAIGCAAKAIGLSVDSFEYLIAQHDMVLYEILNNSGNPEDAYYELQDAGMGDNYQHRNGKTEIEDQIGDVDRCLNLVEDYPDFRITTWGDLVGYFDLHWDNYCG